MATYTENYDLVKPEESDYYNVEVFNENMDTIDSVMAAAEAATENVGEKVDEVGEKVDALDEKLGSSAEGNTLFSLLEGGTKSGLTAVKSIQHVSKTLTNSTTSTSILLETPVVPENCIMWMEPLSVNRLNQLSYTLTKSSVEMTHSNPSTGYTFIYGFWIIEFC